MTVELSGPIADWARVNSMLGACRIRNFGVNMAKTDDRDSRSFKKKLLLDPWRLGARAMEMIQLSLFYAAFTDIATGEYVRLPSGIENMDKLFAQKGMDKQTYDECWKLFEEHLSTIKNMPYQSVLISMNSRWDWFVRNIKDYVGSSMTASNQATLDKKIQSSWNRVDRLPILEQLKAIESIGEDQFDLAAENCSELEEMTLVRNLGLHNNWEIDEIYLRRTIRRGYKLGATRVLALPELMKWHEILHQLIIKTCKMISNRFCAKAL